MLYTVPLKIWFLMTGLLLPVESSDLLKIFVSGGDREIPSIQTPWKNTSGRWVVKSEAGIVGQGTFQTDARGITALKVDFPKVRVPVRMALILACFDKTFTWEMVVLPKNPLAESRERFRKLGIGILSSGILDPILKKSGLEYTRLPADTDREAFKGKVVILEGRPEEGNGPARAWIDSLPAGTCLILISTNSDKLRKEEKAAPNKLFIQPGPPVWTDLPASWFDWAGSSYRLTEFKGITFLKIWAGTYTSDGSMYPMVYEMKDIQNHSWLIWNLPNPSDKTDPRWEFILRNNLAWAYHNVFPKEQDIQDNGGSDKKR